MNGMMSGFLGERELSEVQELLRPPAERDLPPGQLARRRQTLLEAIAAPEGAAEPERRLRDRLRRLAVWLGCLLAAVAVGLGAVRIHAPAGAHSHRGQVAEVAALVGAGTTIFLHAAPGRRAGQDVVLRRAMTPSGAGPVALL
jgi:hypothetical protein